MKVVTKTESAKLHFKHENVRRDQHAQEIELAAREFPIGTKVRWIYSFKRPDEGGAPIYRFGSVVEPAKYSTSIGIKMKPGGPTHHVHAHLLDIVIDEGGAS